MATSRTASELQNSCHTRCVYHVEGIAHDGLLVRRLKAHDQVEGIPRWLRAAGDDPEFLRGLEAAGQSPREGHAGPVGRRSGLPVDRRELLAAEFLERLPPAAAVSGLEREAKRERIVGLAVEIDHGPAAILGPHDLERPADERGLNGPGASAADKLDGHPLTGPRAGEHVGKRHGIGRGRPGNPHNDVARPQAGQVGRCGLAHDRDPTPFGDGLGTEMAQVSGTVFLVVKPLVRKLDPFDRPPATRERDEHFRGVGRVERAEREPHPGGGFRSLLRSGGAGWIGGVARGGQLTGRWRLRRLACGSGILGHGRYRWPGKQERLQHLAGDHDRKRDRKEQDVATFHSSGSRGFRGSITGLCQWLADSAQLMPRPGKRGGTREVESGPRPVIALG